MAKYLLYIYVVFFSLITLADIVFGDPSSFKDPHWNLNMFWIIVMVLAIVEAIEKIKK